MGGKTEGQIDESWRKGPFFTPDNYVGPDYEEWKDFFDLPETLRKHVIESLRLESEQSIALANRVRGRRPGQVKVELMWAKVYQLAADALKAK